MTPYSRRDFTKLALAALPAAGLLSSASPLRAAGAAKPNSKVRGVQIGLNAPYSFGQPTMSADEILANCVKLGLSGVELRAQSVEVFLGAPSEIVYAKAAVATGGNTPPLAAWRKTAPVAKAADYRKKFNDAGVAIEIVKVDRIFNFSDAELDYAFTLAKALGARAISTEISKKEEEHKRVGAFADKHQLLVGLHGHHTSNMEHFERAFAHAKFLGANLDIGHYVGGGNGSPVDFLKKHHARVSHIHVKDRKVGTAAKGGDNMPFGQGDTPIRDVLRLIRDNKWPIQATIEYEYRVPAGSDRMAEIAKCIQFCRDALA
jgi:sugar phosphate isomerase/epimerase